MYDPEDIPGSRRPREKEYQDCHYHHEEIVPADDVEPWRTRPPAPGRRNRRPPVRRHGDPYDDA